MGKRGYRHNSPLANTNQPYAYFAEEYLRDHQELAKRQRSRPLRG